MAAGAVHQRTRQAVGIFHDVGRLAGALERLAAAGFEAADLCLLGRRTAIEQAQAGGDAQLGRHLGVDLGDRAMLAGGDKAGLVVVGQGRLARWWAKELQAGAVDQAQPFLVPWLPERSASMLQVRLRAAAVLLWIEIDDSDQEQCACKVLLHHGQSQVQVHDLIFHV